MSITINQVGSKHLRPKNLTQDTIKDDLVWHAVAALLRWLLLNLPTSQRGTSETRQDLTIRFQSTRRQRNLEPKGHYGHGFELGTRKQEQHKEGARTLFPLTIKTPMWNSSRMRLIFGKAQILGLITPSWLLESYSDHSLKAGKHDEAYSHNRAILR